MPPRGDNCSATIFNLPRRPLQYGAKRVWAEPVTGSSSIPMPGAKKRETKSISPPGAVTISPRAFSSAIAAKSGSKSSRVRLSSKTAIRSKFPLNSNDGSAPRQSATRLAFCNWLGGSRGKSRYMMSISIEARSNPLALVNSIVLEVARYPSSNNINAAARVACPHSSTSDIGVNQRIAKGIAPKLTKAVSDRLFSAAIDCIVLAGNASSSRHTAAGLPENNVSVNASTWKT